MARQTLIYGSTIFTASHTRFVCQAVSVVRVEILLPRVRVHSAFLGVNTTSLGIHKSY